MGFRLHVASQVEYAVALTLHSSRLQTCRCVCWFVFVLPLFVITACQEAVETSSTPTATAEPKAIRPIEDLSLTLVGPTAIKVIDVAGNFDDPDAGQGDRLTFTAKSSDVAIVSASVNGSKITVTAVTIGTADITVTATDKDKLTAKDTFTVTVSPESAPGPTEQAPVAVGSISNMTVTVGGSPASVDVAGSFNDPDHQTLTYAARSSAQQIATALASGSTVTVNAVAEGTATVTVTATDEDNLTATQTFNVTVNAASTPGPTARAPIAIGAMSNMTLTVGASPGSVDVAANFNDPDGQTLTYTATSSAQSIATASATGSTVTVNAVVEGTATVTVTATDEDNLTATQTFNVTVNAASTPRPMTLPFSEVVNPGGNALADKLYTLELGTSSGEVFLISTNTTTNAVAPHIVRHDSSQRGERISRPRQSASQPAPEPAWLRELELPPRQRVDGLTDRRRHLAQVLSPVAEGDSFSFTEHRDNGVLVSIPATVRRVIRAGATTLAVWVADREWRATCVFVEQCLTQDMVDAFATRFLRPGASNDIYDWVTAIFGVPWGPHGYSNMLPPAAAGEIHILLLDIEGDGTGGDVFTLGYYHNIHNVLRDPVYPATHASAQRLIFFMDSALLSIPEGPTWEVNDHNPSKIVSTLAHEFQHMIHYYQKQIVSDLPYPPLSEAWLDEMASLLAEDLVADKLEIPGPRGVAHNEPTAGAAGSTGGRLPLYNVHNDIQVTAWSGLLANYSINYALGAYLARNYGGAALFREIVQNDSASVAAIEEALSALGYSASFADVLTDWAVANLLSDDTDTPLPYRYNSGTWFTSAAADQTFRLGSINLFNYSAPHYSLDGPYLYSLLELNGAPPQPPHSNRYVSMGRTSGTVRLRINAPTGNRITVIAKQ